MVQLIDRFRGTLLGVHAGDSLGAPYEKKTPQVIAIEIDRREGFMPFDYADPFGQPGIFLAGQPTDDTELTAALATSFIESKGFNLSQQYDFFRQAVLGKSFVWEGKAAGFGGTTKKMLSAETFEEAQSLVPTHGDMPASNGSLMRSSPLALWFYDAPADVLMDCAAASSRITHVHATAIQCCKLYGILLRELLRGYHPEEAWPYCRQRYDKHIKYDVLPFVGEVVPMPEATNIWMGKGGLAGSAVHTLHIAVWCLLNADDFREGIELAIRFGGDTDTAAAVTGSLLGAFYGVDAIPTEWLNVLKGKERMMWLADELHAGRPT